MTQQDSIYTTPQPEAFSLQTSNDSLARFYDERSILYAMTQEDYLYIDPEGLSLHTANKSFSRFFVEKGKTEMNEIKRLKSEAIPIWIHLSLFFWVFVILLARLSYSIRLRQIIVATINPQQAKQILREGTLLKQGFSLLLMLLFIFSISLFGFLVFNKEYPNSFYFSIGQSFLLLVAIIALFYVGKFITIWLLGILFETQTLSRRYLLDHYLFFITDGIFLFPLLILFVYSGLLVFVYIALLVFVGLWLYRLQRAIAIGLDCINFSPSYLFLYLCTLEVVPFFLIYKLIEQFA